MTVTTDYLQTIYDVKAFQKTADSCLRAAEAMMKANPFDAIAFTGTSGAAMAYILSNMMGVPLICVRKPTESSHYAQSGYGVIEGFVASKRYMIVDDMICSGATLRRIMTAVSDRIPDAELVGIVLYNRHARQDDIYHTGIATYVPVMGCKPEELR